MRIESGSLVLSLNHCLVRNVITIQGSEEAKRPETPETVVDTESAFLNVGCFYEPLSLILFYQLVSDDGLLLNFLSTSDRAYNQPYSYFRSSHNYETEDEK